MVQSRHMPAPPAREPMTATPTKNAEHDRPDFDWEGLPPGPRLPYAVQTGLVWQLTGPFLRYCRRRYGPTFTLRAYPSKASVYITEPADLKAAFTADADVLHAGEANTILGPVLGKRSVLLADEDEHLRRRRLMLPLFHGDSIRGYGEVVAEIADAEIATWPAGTPFRLHKRMQAITLEVILRAVIGVDDPARLARLRVALRRIVDFAPGVLLMWVWPRLGGVGRWRRQRRWQAEAEAMLNDEIARRRTAADLEERTDILSLLIRARYDDGSAMDDDELRDQILTLLLAGHETTATGLAWAFERLARHPDVLARATRAAQEGDDSYLDAVVKETLRVRPVIPDVARLAIKPITLGGYDLPAGVTIMPCITLVQHGDAFPDAGSFRPERFLEEDSAPPYGWIPFGGGRRRCLGAAFATFEMRIVLERVLRQVELTAPSHRGEWALPHHITTVPIRGARLIVRSR
jgi:cytochrome P450 family 135